MHSIKKLLPLLLFAAFLSSCSEDFEVAAPYKPMTIIYGLMDIGDTAHYIRIQKAFLDEHKSAIDMAKEEDSNYYNPAILSVQLKEFNNGTLLPPVETLQRVDLNNENLPKDSGVFYGPRNTHNWAYKTKRTLVQGNTYRLVVSNTATGQVDSAETGIIANFSPEFYITQFIRKPYTLDFPAVPGFPDRFLLSVNVPDKNAQIFEGIIRFHYVDKVGTTQTDHAADWHFASISRGTDKLELETTQQSFYYFLSGAIGLPPAANVERYMDSVDMFVWAGSIDLSNYQKINGAQGGITADQIKPLYTNFRSNRVNSVLGLFTTRARIELHNVAIGDQTLDSLRFTGNAITSALNIQGRSDH